MKLIGRYKNGNILTAIFSDGTKIRETDDDEFIPAFAENMDIKITDCCDLGCGFVMKVALSTANTGMFSIRSSLAHCILIKRSRLAVAMLQAIPILYHSFVGSKRKGLFLI